jgi:hypothetical protein
MITSATSCYRNCYLKYGDRAAKLALLPGLGQFRNRHYLRAVATAGTFCSLIFALAYLHLLELVGLAQQKGGLLRGGLLLGLLILWELSLWDTYRGAIERRRLDGQRFNLQVATTVRGLDVQTGPFEEETATENLSKLGACLLLSKEVAPGALLELELAGLAEHRARVIWQKPTGTGNQRLVGVELLVPLTTLCPSERSKP